jgi:hypothetical protein
VDPVGRAGYVVNPKRVTNTDKNGPGTLPGPEADGIGENGQPVEQRPYSVTNQKWFRDTNKLIDRRFRKLRAARIARRWRALNEVDTLVLSDVPAPRDPRGRRYKKAAYYKNLRRWVMRGGNLVLTDRAMHALGKLEVVPADAVEDIRVYQPYANFRDLEHPMTQGLRSNARQLVEAATLGYGIGDDESPMTVVDTAAWEEAGGHVIGTTSTTLTGEDPAVDRNLDDGSLTSVGELELGKRGGRIRVVGGALPMPTETQDHRYGLRNYALTYSGLFLMENAIEHDVKRLGKKRKKR